MARRYIMGYDMVSAIATKLKYYLSLIGKAPLCNKRPERAPRFVVVWPLCWRCCGVFLGAVLIYLFHYFNTVISPRTALFLILCSLPGLVDVGVQRYLGVDSTNPRRFLTGVMIGISLLGWALMIKWIITGDSL